MIHDFLNFLNKSLAVKAWFPYKQTSKKKINKKKIIILRLKRSRIRLNVNYT